MRRNKYHGKDCGPFLPTLSPFVAPTLPTSCHLFAHPRCAYSVQQVIKKSRLIVLNLLVVDKLTDVLRRTYIDDVKSTRQMSESWLYKEWKVFVWSEQRFANKLDSLVAARLLLLFTRTIRFLSFEGNMKQTIWPRKTFISNIIWPFLRLTVETL